MLRFIAVVILLIFAIPCAAQSISGTFFSNSTLALLPTTNVTVGSTAYVTDCGCNYTYTSSGWTAETQAISTVTASFTTDATIGMVLADTTSAAVVETLPACTAVPPFSVMALVTGEEDLIDE